MTQEQATAPETVAPGYCAPFSVVRMDDEEAAELARAFKAIAHPVRLQILDILSRYGGDVCVCDVENQFVLSQPTISHHLRVLRQAGLVDWEHRGPWVYYFVRPGPFEKLQGFLGTVAS